MGGEGSQGIHSGGAGYHPTPELKYTTARKGGAGEVFLRNRD